MWKVSVLLFVLMGCAGDLSRLPHKWPVRDQILGATFVALTAIDIAQTAGPGGIAMMCREDNPLVGQCGNKMGVGPYFAWVYFMMAGTASIIVPKARTALLGGAVGIEAWTVYDNDRQGWNYFGDPHPSWIRPGSMK